MSRRLRRSGALLAVPAAVLLASCSTGQPSTAGQTSASSATSMTPSSPAPTTSSAAPTSSAPAAAAAPQRSKALLHKALLGIDDLPAGFSVEPADQSSKGGPQVSSKDPRCKTLVAIMNADSAPGATAAASTSFSGGQDGPWIDEQLAAMGGAERVSAFHARVRAAVKSCSKLTLRLPQGTSTMAVRTVKAPEIGKDPVAFRISAQGGPLDGFESTQVATGVGDVELMMSFLGAVPDDIDGGTQVAYDKAEQTLGVKTPSAS